MSEHTFSASQSLVFGHDPATQQITIFFDPPIPSLTLTIEQAELFVQALQQQLTHLQATQN